MELFELVENTERHAIVKVKPLNNILIAKHPYLSINMDYINITKGRNHVFTIIYKNGQTFDFEFGESGHTLIDNNLRNLKSEVIEFLKSNDVYIEVQTFNQPDTIDIFTCRADLMGSYSVFIEYGNQQTIRKSFDTKAQAFNYVSEHFETEVVYHSNQQAAAFDLTNFRVISGNILAERFEM